jgi:hypothetical protein
LSQKWGYRIYRKTGPTKSTVLGPGPPPWENDENYRFLLFFIDFGAFNRAGKSVTKIGIYSKPPPKSEIYSAFINSRPNLSIFNNSLPITELFALYFGPWYCIFTLPFFGIQSEMLL